MFRKAIAAGAGVHQPWRMISRRHSSVVSSAVNSILLRSLKDHYLEVSKMAPPPKVNPPADFTIMKGALDSNGPDHRNLMRWFRSVGLFVNGRETDKGTDEAAANASKSNAAK
uniref:Uncharacterized protein n=1 Tax=Chenopodium quinoa TaxID=63459 RepID=A0A803LH33_CHEQI